jgi:hypothetical protein
MAVDVRTMSLPLKLRLVRGGQVLSGADHDVHRFLGRLLDFCDGLTRRRGVSGNPRDFDTQPDVIARVGRVLSAERVVRERKSDGA